jgi:hypothetical protein
VVPSTTAADKIAEPVLLLKEKSRSFDNADARGSKRVQNLRKVEAEVRSADTFVCTMHG